MIGGNTGVKSDFHLSLYTEVKNFTDLCIDDKRMNDIIMRKNSVQTTHRKDDFQYGNYIKQVIE